MKRWQAPVGFYLTLVFLSGVVVGSFGLRLYMVKSVSATVAARQPTAEEYRRQMLNEMQKRINLRPDQVTKVNAVLDNTRVCFRRIHSKIEPELQALKKQQVADIRALLSPEQQVKYDQWRAERDRAAR
jgi:hypothetical protein